MNRTIFWNPTGNNVGQKVYYKKSFENAWTSSNLLSSTANSYTVPMVGNIMYHLKIASLCNNQELETPLYKSFAVSLDEWSYSIATNKSSITVNWNFTDISDMTSLKVILYNVDVNGNIINYPNGDRYDESNITPSLSGSYTFNNPLYSLITGQYYKLSVGVLYNNNASFKDPIYPITDPEQIAHNDTVQTYYRYIQFQLT